MRALAKLWFVALLGEACSAPKAGPAAPAAFDTSSSPATALSTPAPRSDARESQPSSAEIPVDADDAVWGDAAAPVTLVVFTDLQCPFCAEGHEAVVALQRRYGEARLRVVVKHVPLANHPFAVPAARVAQALLALSGRRAFFRYVDRAFTQPDQIAAGRVLELAAPLGVDPTRLRQLAESAAIGQQVLGDVLLADRLKVPATPHYRLNGLPITGVQPAEVLAPLVDAELDAAARLVASGLRAGDVYAARVRENVAKPEP